MDVMHCVSWSSGHRTYNARETFVNTSHPVSVTTTVSEMMWSPFPVLSSQDMKWNTMPGLSSMANAAVNLLGDTGRSLDENRMAATDSIGPEVETNMVMCYFFESVSRKKWQSGMSQEVIQQHYTRLGSSYNENLYYSNDFVRRITSKMIGELDLQIQDILVDLGGGTGMYSKDILEQVPLETPVVLVDPFEEMLARARDGERLECVCADALSFSERDRAYDKVLMKEAVHHVDDRPRLFENLHERLTDDGAILLVHVPPELDYPLFEKALERSKRWHADPDQLEAQLAEVGFDVERDGLDLRHRMPKETYFRMVEAQYMSVLSSFDDDELEAGLEEMARTYADTDVLEFTDHFDFIAGHKA